MSYFYVFLFSTIASLIVDLLPYLLREQQPRLRRRCRHLVLRRRRGHKLSVAAAIGHDRDERTRLNASNL